MAGVVGVTLLLSATAAWRLSQGPVSLDFAVPYVQEQLAGLDGRVKVEFSDVVLTWGGWDRTLDIRVTGVSARDRNGAAIAEAPDISVSLAMFPLFRGEIVPTRLELIRPRLYARRSESGDLELSVGRLTDSGGGSLHSLIRAMLDPKTPDPIFAALESVGIVGGDLQIEDRALDTRWRANRLDLQVAREEDALAARFSFDAVLEDQTPKISGDVRYEISDGTISIDGSITKTRLDRLAKQVPLPSAFSGVGLPLDLDFRIGLTPDGALRDGRFRLTAGSGTLHFPNHLPRTVPVRSASARGRFDAAASRIVLEEATMDVGGSTLSLSAVIGNESGKLTANAEVGLRKMTLADFKSYWPPESDPGLHEWVTRNLEDGDVVRAGARLRARRSASGQWSMDGIRGDLQLHAVTVHYLKPLIPVREVDASVTFVPGRVDIAIDRGDLNGLAIDSGSISIPDDGAGNWTLALEVVLRGGVRNALEILDHPKLKYAKELGIDVAQVTGRTAVRMRVALPLIAKLTLPQVDIRAAAKLADVDLPGAVFGHDARNGALTLQLDRGGMTVSGTATLAQIPAAIVWFESFDDQSPIARRYDVKATLDDDDRRRLGLDTAPYMIGPAFAEITLIKRSKGPSELTGKLMLDETTLMIKPFGWTKPVTAPSEAAFEAILEGDHIASVSGFEIKAPGLVARGDFAFAEDGKTLSRATIRRLAIGDRTDISGAVARRDDGVLDISISGSAFDGENLLKTASEPERDETRLPPMRLIANVDRLWIDAKAKITDVKLSAEHDDTHWRRIAATGRSLDKNGLRAIYREADRDQSITLETENAGALLRALDASDNVSGGQLVLKASKVGSAAAAPWRGTLAMTDFRVTKAPVLTRLLTLASMTAIADLFAGRGLAFNRLDIPFEMESKQLTISNARAVGSEVGITVNGGVDLKGGTTSLEGTVVPAYTLNSLVGRIPILGKIFTGGEGGGVFAVNFSISGPLKEPRIRVNPLSALAPGILRNLLRDLGKSGTMEPLPEPEIPD